MSLDSIYNAITDLYNESINILQCYSPNTALVINSILVLSTTIFEFLVKLCFITTTCIWLVVGYIAYFFDIDDFIITESIASRHFSYVTSYVANGCSNLGGPDSPIILRLIINLFLLVKILCESIITIVYFLYMLPNSIAYTIDCFFNMFVSFFSYTHSVLVGPNTLFMLTLVFMLYCIVVSCSTIGMMVKLLLYTTTCILYLVYLNLDPWACFLVVVGFSTIFLLTVVLNSLRVKTTCFSFITVNRFLCLCLCIFTALLVLKSPYCGIDSFYINVYKNSMLYSNTDFFGILIELFLSPVIVPYVITTLAVVNSYIIIRFKFRKSSSLYGYNPFSYMSSVIGKSYSGLIDQYFINVSPFVKKWFRF